MKERSRLPTSLQMLSTVAVIHLPQQPGGQQSGGQSLGGTPPPQHALVVWLMVVRSLCLLLSDLFFISPLLTHLRVKGRRKNPNLQPFKPKLDLPPETLQIRK